MRVISDSYPVFGERRPYEEMLAGLILLLHGELWEISCVATNVGNNALRHYDLSENCSYKHPSAYERSSSGKCTLGYKVL